jgi:hypothetical protein
MTDRSIDAFDELHGSQVDHVPATQLSTVALVDRGTSPGGVLFVEAAADLCGCGHAAQRHDAHASRYCRATVSNELRRGCICVDPTAESAGRR